MGGRREHFAVSLYYSGRSLTLCAEALKLRTVLRLSWMSDPRPSGGRRHGHVREGFLSRFFGFGLRVWVVSAVLGLLAPVVSRRTTIIPSRSIPTRPCSPC